MKVRHFYVKKFFIINLQNLIINLYVFPRFLLVKSKIKNEIFSKLIAWEQKKNPFFYLERVEFNIFLKKSYRTCNAISTSTISTSTMTRPAVEITLRTCYFCSYYSFMGKDTCKVANLPDCTHSAFIFKPSFSFSNISKYIFNSYFSSFKFWINFSFSCLWLDKSNT